MEAKGVPPISEILAKSPDNMTSDDAFRVFQEHQIPLYEAIKQRLGEIGKRTEELKALTDQRAQTADSEGMGKIDEKANRVVQEVQAFAAAIKKTLDELNRENKDFTAKFHDAENSSSLQMRIKLFALHIILYKEALGEFSRAHTKFLDDAKSGQKRRLQQVSAAQPESRLDAKEIDDLVESGRAAEVIQQAIISDDLRSCIAEIEQRHDKILALERDIRSLYEVFKDVAKLVDVQQNSIDIIEDHIQKAKGYTEKAEQALTSAEKHQKCSRTGMCCICVIVTVVLLGILLPTIIISLQKA